MRLEGPEREARERGAASRAARLPFPALALFGCGGLCAGSFLFARESLIGVGLSVSLLLCAVLYALAALRSRSLEQAAELRFAATHDALTGLPNRALFHEQLAHALSRAARHRRAVAVLFLDLDRFKAVNDTLGHGAGDALLRECARRLKESLRQSDVVARLSGDEFAVVMEDYGGPRDGVIVAKKILARLAAPVPLEGSPFTPSASIGISVFPEDGATLEPLLKNADIAMYRAKARGRNGYEFYSAQSNQRALERQAMEASLRGAIERGELALEYQPKLDLASRAVAGVEALLHWRHPELGPLAPAKFMPLAEEIGLAPAIDDWALRRAAEQARAWREAGLLAGRVALDIAARQLARRDFADRVREILAATGARADSLEFEIGERLLMQSPELTAGRLRGLSGLGIALTIDDFGAGYSSLAYLKDLPAGALKIDASFVRSVPGDANGAAIAQGVIALGRSLGLEVIAQGVETAEQERFLLAQGCGRAQGALLCKPLSAQDMTAFLRRPAERPHGVPGRERALRLLK